MNPNREPARGVPGRSGTVQVCVAFDVDTFEEIRARANAEKTSFAAQVRLLCEWGLEADNDAQGDC